MQFFSELSMGLAKGNKIMNTNSMGIFAQLLPCIWHCVGILRN